MKNVLITGASSGIGKELARLYAESGANVALTARRKDSLKKIADELKSSGAKGKILFASLDVSDADQNFKVIPKLAKELGGLDLIVLNAGISTTSSFGGRSFEADRAVIETNLIGAMAGVEAALPIFQKQNRDRSPRSLPLLPLEVFPVPLVILPRKRDSPRIWRLFAEK